MKTRSDPPPRPRPRIEPQPKAEPEPKPEPAPTPAPQPEAASPEPRAGAIIEEVQRLRRSGEYERAADHLRNALKQRWPTRTADVLSYELGSILARHLHDPSRACAHWRAHLERFRATRYRRQVEASISSLGCP